MDDTGSTSTIRPSPTLARLPYEILMEMISHLIPVIRHYSTPRESYASLLSLCLVNPKLGAIALWSIYHTIQVGSPQHMVSVGQSHSPS